MGRGLPAGPRPAAADGPTCLRLLRGHVLTVLDECDDTAPTGSR